MIEKDRSCNCQQALIDENNIEIVLSSLRNSTGTFPILDFNNSGKSALIRLKIASIEALANVFLIGIQFNSRRRKT